MSVLTDLPELLKKGLRRHKVPGAALAVYRRGRMYEAAAGVLNLNTRVPATPDSVFQIGSISKIFTATLIMQLVDEGLLDLDVPVREYLSGFAVADGKVSRIVTPRHLLTHTSGIEGDFFVDSGRGDDSIARLQDMGTMLPNLFPPGERLSYCNFGFAMLGRITEVLTGLTWDRAIRERLFEPLGMTHALTLPEDTVKFRAAIGHVPNPKKRGESMITPMPWLAFGQKAAGSTPSMSAADLLKFAAMHLDRGITKTGSRILSRQSVRQMQQPQIRLPRHFARGIDAWGLGWMLMRCSGRRVIGHDGGTVGQYAFLRLVPEADLGIALLTNGGDAGALYDAVFSTLLDGLAKIELPDLPQVDDAVRIDPPRYVGRYANIAGVTEISERRSKLYLAVEPTGLAGAPIGRTELAFVDRNTARLVSDDPLLSRSVFLFQDPADDPVRYVLTTRLSRRLG